MRRILPALLLLLVGCASPPDLSPIPDPPADDDDSAPELPEPAFASTATFAVVMEGEVDDTDAPSSVLTKGEGVFQFVYWDEDGQTPLCRQRVPFLSEARFGPLASSSCGGCLGMLELEALETDAVDDAEDACDPDMLGDQDLSFLLQGDDSDAARGDDFTRMALVTLDDLLSDDWLLTEDGLHVEELIATYESAGLAATHLAMVRPAGWVGDHAGLDGIATPWGLQGWLPMFVVYRDADRPTDADWLPGEVYMTSLWQVALAEPANEAPESDSANYR